MVDHAAGRAEESLELDKVSTAYEISQFLARCLRREDICCLRSKGIDTAYLRAFDRSG